MKTAIAAEGHVVSGDAGEATDKGVTLTWAYDPAARTLTIQCTRHPFVMPCALVNATIKRLYENSGC